MEFTILLTTKSRPAWAGYSSKTLQGIFMRYSPYEWNESINQRNDYIEDKLKEGSPVVALSYDNGILLLTLRRTQRKIYEIYDRLIFSAIGNQSDIESIRTGAIDIAHREGFSRSPDDVSVQRIVGFAVSPSIKKVYADPYSAPVVLRALFAELHKVAADDQYFIVSYDGEFTSNKKLATIGGTPYAESQMVDYLKSTLDVETPNLDVALKIAIHAWGIGRVQTDPDAVDDDSEPAADRSADIDKFIEDRLAEGWVVEAAVLERSTHRESRYRQIPADQLVAAASV
jgi:proteasome alpha subunit